MKKALLKTLFSIFCYFCYMISALAASNYSMNSSPSYAAQYLSKDELQQRFEWGYAEKLADVRLDKLYFRLLRNGVSQIQLENWSDLGWVERPQEVEFLIHYLKQNKIQEALTIASNLDLSKVSELHKIEILLLSLKVNNEQVQTQVIDLLNVGNQPLIKSSFNDDNFASIYSAFRALQNSESLTKANAIEVKGAFDKHKEFRYLHKSISSNLSLKTAEVIYDWLEDKSHLKQRLLDNELYQFLEHLDTLQIIKLSTKEREQVVLFLDTKEQKKRKENAVLNLDGSNAEQAAELVSLLVQHKPYAADFISKINIVELSNEAKYKLLEWALSVDHQTLIRELVTEHSLQLEDMNERLMPFFLKTAAPLFWYQEFSTGAVRIAANQMLRKSCSREVAGDKAFLITLIDFSTLSVQDFECVFKTSSNRNIVLQAWYQVTSLPTEEKLKFYKILISHRFSLFSSLVNDKQIIPDHNLLLKALKSKDMQAHLFENGDQVLNLGLNDEQINELFQFHLQTKDDVTTLFINGRHLIPLFDSQIWFQEKLCLVALSENNSMFYTTALNSLTKNKFQCSTKVINKVILTDDFHWDIERVEHLLPGKIIMRLLFDLLESKRYFYFRQYIEKHGEDLLFITNSAGESLYEKVKSHFKSNDSVAYTLRSLIQDVEFNSAYSNNELSPKERLLQAAEQLPRGLSLFKFNSVLLEYPYSSKQLFKVVDNASNSDNISYRTLLLTLLSKHLNFKEYPNQWALYRNIFFLNRPNEVQTLLDYYNVKGYQLSDLKLLPDNVKFECYELVDYIKAGLSKNIKTQSGRSLFESVVKKTMAPSCLTKLIELGINVDDLSPGYSIYHDILINMRGEKESSDKIVSIFEEFKRNGFKVKSNSNMNNKLIYAAARFDRQVLMFLLDNGIDINEVAHPNYPPIGYIIDSRDLNLFKYAVGKGADLNVDYNGQPLIFLALQKSEEITKWMIENKYPTCVKNKAGKTLYQQARDQQLKNIIKLHGGNKCH